VGPKAGLDDVEKKILSTLPVLELRSFGLQTVANRYTDCSIPVQERQYSQNRSFLSFQRLCIRRSIIMGPRVEREFARSPGLVM
jgi:hypothetical protein